MMGFTFHKAHKWENDNSFKCRNLLDADANLCELQHDPHIRRTLESTHLPFESLSLSLPLDTQ